MPAASVTSSFFSGSSVAMAVRIGGKRYWGVHLKHPKTPVPHVGNSGVLEIVLVCDVRLPFAS
jgi:hypothetical protein